LVGRISLCTIFPKVRKYSDNLKPKNRNLLVTNKKY